MAKKNRQIKLRPANDVLEKNALNKSRIAKINGSNQLFLVSPQFLNDSFVTRHLTFLTRIGNENVLSDGMLKVRYWSVSFYDPSDWHGLFSKMDDTIKALKASRENRLAKAC